MTQQLTLTAPVIFSLNSVYSEELTQIVLAVLLAMIVGNQLSVSVFDVFLIEKKLPFLPTVRFDRTAHLVARDVMRSEEQVARFTTIEKLVKLLQRLPEHVEHLALVDNRENKYLLGCVSAQKLDDFVVQEYMDRVKAECETDDCQSHTEYLNHQRVHSFTHLLRLWSWHSESHQLGEHLSGKLLSPEMVQKIDREIDMYDLDLEINPSPFQLVQQTSLPDVLFLMSALVSH